MSDESGRVRIGMVGGSPGSHIGESHRIGMRLDDRYALLAGVFSRDAERSDAFGRTLGVAPDRLYPDYRAMGKTDAPGDISYPTMRDGVIGIRFVSYPKLKRLGLPSSLSEEWGQGFSGH